MQLLTVRMEQQKLQAPLSGDILLLKEISLQHEDGSVDLRGPPLPTPSLFTPVRRALAAQRSLLEHGQLCLKILPRTLRPSPREELWAS